MKLLRFIPCVFLSGAIHAAIPINGWYDSLFGGYAYLPNNLNIHQFNYTYTNASYQSGFDVGANFGYKSNPMRYEGEVTYLKANIDKYSTNYIPQHNVNGYNNALFGMANIYYDFNGIVECIQPFLGVGIGYGWVQTNIDSQGPLYITSFNSSNSAFAYQATAGLTYNFAENYSLNIGYRYIATSHISAFGDIFQANLANVGATYRFDGNNYK